jgi:hypothetical protein
VDTELYLLARPGIIARPEGDAGEMLLFDPESERVKVLNRTGAWVWELCDGRHSQANVIDALVAAYPSMTQNEVAADVRAFLQDLLDLGLVETVASP